MTQAMVMGNKKTLSIYARMAEAVLTGERKQVIIRKRGRKVFSVGDLLKLYRRTRSYQPERPIRMTRCDEVLDIHINNTAVILNNRVLMDGEREQLARDDGFDDYADFLAFFRANGGLPLDGQLVRWL